MNDKLKAFGLRTLKDSVGLATVIGQLVLGAAMLGGVILANMVLAFISPWILFFGIPAGLALVILTIALLGNLVDKAMDWSSK